MIELFHQLAYRRSALEVADICVTLSQYMRDTRGLCALYPDILAIRCGYNCDRGIVSGRIIYNLNSDKFKISSAKSGQLLYKYDKFGIRKHKKYIINSELGVIYLHNIPHNSYILLNIYKDDEYIDYRINTLSPIKCKRIYDCYNIKNAYYHALDIYQSRVKGLYIK